MSKSTKTADSLKPKNRKEKNVATGQSKGRSRTKKQPQPESPDTRYTNRDDGVWRFDGERWQWLSDPLEVVAQARTEHGTDWGALVRFRDRDGTWREWNIPHELFASDGGTEVIRRLLSEGLKIGAKRHVRRNLLEYLMGADPENRVLLVSKMGWHGDAFMLPDNNVIGDTKESLYYYSDAPAMCQMANRGTLREWKNKVASLAVGNDLAVFALCSAFAAPLLNGVGSETCGFHFKGDSSWGKSTLLKLAASVCGQPDKDKADTYMKNWRATDNALEAIAAAHSDCLLPLDEIGQVDPKIVGEVVYMLGNGQGKARANDRGGSAGIRHQWRLVFLSSGEKSLLDLMTVAGKKPQAGMEVRLLAIPATFHRKEADIKRYGIYQDLHGYAGGADLAEELDRRMSQAHGTALPAFLEALIEWLREASAWPYIEEITARMKGDSLSDKASGQASRSAGKFALIAAAGELATEWGITGWEPGTSYQASLCCFLAWLDDRGGEGSYEERAMLEQVRGLLEKYGESRFTRWDRNEPSTDSHAPRTQERWGYRRTVTDSDFTEGHSSEAHFYVLPDAFRNELAKGYDYKRVARQLAELGALTRDGDRFTARVRLPDMGPGQKRCYVINAGALYPDAVPDKSAA